MHASEKRYPPIADYALISDCHCCALVSCHGSVDWCCMPRLDDDSCFGRLLDWDKGGYCAISPTAEKYYSTRRYLENTMILETRFSTSNGDVRIIDFFARDPDEVEQPNFDLVRIVEGISGEVELQVDVVPRFDYAEIVPHVRCAGEDGDGIYTAVGSDKGLIIHSEAELNVVEHQELRGTFRIREGERCRVMIQFAPPEKIDQIAQREKPDAATVDGCFESTRKWWQDWVKNGSPPHMLDEQTTRSTIVLKSLTFDRTGAIAAAPTTSLPEAMGGSRNWDYRFSWIRDSVFTVRALHLLGYSHEADRFHRFIQRSSAGNAAQMQIMYGVDGKRRLTEIELSWLEGYRKSGPVRIGNRAAKQMQLDIYGELLEMAWEWHTSSHETEPDYWDFLCSVMNLVCDHWGSKDRGIWEVRGDPADYVHSKVMCWAALNRGVMLARENGFPAPIDRWESERDRIREAVEDKGYNAEDGNFVQAFGTKYLDAALLLLPRVGFVDYDDPRMIRTTDAIRKGLERNGLLLRYDSSDGLSGKEGAFLPCTFWLVSCLAYQDRRDLAWDYYNRAVGCANELGLFSEEYDIEKGEMLGNFPQALTHVSQVMAKLALDGAGPEKAG